MRTTIAVLLCAFCGCADEAPSVKPPPPAVVQKAAWEVQCPDGQQHTWGDPPCAKPSAPPQLGGVYVECLANASAASSVEGARACVQRDHAKVTEALAAACKSARNGTVCVTGSGLLAGDLTVPTRATNALDHQWAGDTPFRLELANRDRFLAAWRRRCGTGSGESEYVCVVLRDLEREAPPVAFLRWKSNDGLHRAVLLSGADARPVDVPRARELLRLHCEVAGDAACVLLARSYLDDDPVDMEQARQFAAQACFNAASERVKSASCELVTRLRRTAALADIPDATTPVEPGAASGAVPGSSAGSAGSGVAGARSGGTP